MRIMRTHSVASVSADVDTSSGCTTASSSMLLTAPLRTLMPAAVSPCNRGRELCLAVQWIRMNTHPLNLSG